MNPLRAAEALRLLTPRVAVPIHWGTFAPANQTAGREFQRQAAELAPEVDVRVLAPGETFTVHARPDHSVAPRGDST
jgi:L-ascorbate metabolism protein UlaG (beta-lactamase superfamily)